MVGLKLDWLKEDQRLFLERGYLKNGQTPEERYAEISKTIQKIALAQCKDSTMNTVMYVSGLEERFNEYFRKGWPSLSTPVISSFGGKENLPISCNHGVIEDSLDGIFSSLRETALLAKNGAGTAINFSDLRPEGSKIETGGKSNSILDWIELYADTMSKVAQNSQRRGFLTAYLSLDHPEIMDFLKIGTSDIPADKQRFFQTITTGIIIPEGWRQALKEGDKEKRAIFTKVLNNRKKTGFPYMLDFENSNIGICQAYLDKGMKIRGSNICIEAMEYTDYEKTFACCLSAVNLYYFEDFKNDPNFIFDMNLMLDCVIEEYITKGSKIPGLEKAVRFAKEHRAIGLGTTGLHSYFQKNNIVFGEMASFGKNNEIFSKLRSESDRASKWMAEVWGEPLVLKGYGERNTSRMAQAPKKSTTFIDGGTHLSLSEGIEPHKSNFCEKKLAKIQVEFKNKELKELLISYGKDTDEIWDQIARDNGSVQNLNFLNAHQKKVFKIFSEVSQVDVIKLAAQRQKYIDMGQSVNLMIHPDTPAKEVIKLHLMAFDEGLKSLYYQYSINAAQKFSQDNMECSVCEG
jgi:ribonucleoside-diphosphate reductase alpha chain